MSNKYLIWHQENIDNQINELTIKDTIEKRGNFFYVLCKCSCGKEKWIKLYNLFHKSVISCGHTSYNPEHQAKRSRKQHPQLSTIKRIFRNYKRDPKDTLTLEQFIELSQQNCYYCGSKPRKTNNMFLSTDYHKTASKFSKDNGNYTWNGVDRIDSNLPHSQDNCVTCCYICNRAKSNMTVNDFKDWIIQVYNYNNGTNND